MLLARVTIYSTLGWLLSNSLECRWDRWEFWCVLGLFWAAEHIARIETREEVIASMERLKQRLEQVLKDRQAQENQDGTTR